MKLTTPEIYKLASELTEKEYSNLFNLFSKEEETKSSILIQLGDTKGIAMWTIISSRYEN